MSALLHHVATRCVVCVVRTREYVASMLGAGVIGVALLLAAVTQAWIGITLVRGLAATVLDG